MAYIELPEFEEMSSGIQEKARPIMEKTGSLGEIFKLLATDEKIYFATDRMVQTYLLDQTYLSYDIKEAIALLISKENSCKMCIGVHKNIARMLGLSDEKIEAILGGIDVMDVEEREKELLRFCIRAAQKDNYKIMQEDLDHLFALGWTKNEVVEAVAIVGYFNYINTLSNVFGLGQ